MAAKRFQGLDGLRGVCALCVGMKGYHFITYGILRGTPSCLAGVVLCRLHARRWFARLPALAPEILLTL
jgi:hypothetical protein